MERQGTTSSPDGLRRQQSDLRAQAARLAEAVALGGNLPSLIQRLRALEDEIARLERAITALRPVNMQVTEEQIRERVLKTMMQLHSTLYASDIGLAKTRF